MTSAVSWLIRLLWLAQPLALGPAVADALNTRSTPVSMVIEGLAWLLWTVGLVAVLVPRTIGLTALRTIAPGALALAVWSALEIDNTIAAVVAVTGAAVATVAAMSPAAGDLFVNGSAYGDERRFALRAPTAVLLGPVAVLWLLVVAGVVAGPLLLAAKQWMWGALALVVGAPLAALGLRSLHQLSRRWLVMVPAGVVIHDPTILTSSLFKRSTIASLGSVPVDTGALDLTGGALGLALQIQLEDTQDVELRQGGKRKLIHARAVMFTPTRPGAVLQEARTRRIRVG